MIDALTKFVKLYATKSTTSKEAIYHLTDYFRNYSTPQTIVSDRGTAFTSQEFREFLAENNVHHVKVATGPPRTNGQVESINRLLTPMIAKSIDTDDKKPWYSVLLRAEYSIKNTINRSTGHTSSTLLFGITQRGNSDAVADFLQESQDKPVRNLVSVRAKAANKILLTQRLNEKLFNSKRKKAHRYKAGDWVMIKNFDCTPGVSKKLIPKYKGPYVITV